MTDLDFSPPASVCGTDEFCLDSDPVQDDPRAEWDAAVDERVKAAIKAAKEAKKQRKKDKKARKEAKKEAKRLLEIAAPFPQEMPQIDHRRGPLTRRPPLTCKTAKIKPPKYSEGKFPKQTQPKQKPKTKAELIKENQELKEKLDKLINSFTLMPETY
jgi:hypothetical protein